MDAAVRRQTPAKEHMKDMDLVTDGGGHLASKTRKTEQPVFTEFESDDSDIPLSAFVAPRTFPDLTEVESDDSSSRNDRSKQSSKEIPQENSQRMPSKVDGHWLTESDELNSSVDEPTRVMAFTELETGDDDNTDFTLYFSSDDTEDLTADFLVVEILATKIAAEASKTSGTVTVERPADEIISDDSLRNAQVHFGRKPTSKKQQELAVGKLVATHLTHYSHDWPQIGEITHVEEDEVKLLWMTGTYSSKWKVVNIRNKGNRGSSAWEENIKKSAIIGEPFSLTPGKKTSRRGCKNSES